MSGGKIRPLRSPLNSDFELNEMTERHLDDIREAFADELIRLWNPLPVDQRR